MIEYINRKDAKNLIEVAIEDSWDVDYTLEMLERIKSSDVIERSKIDEAIDKIDFLRQHRAKYITEDNKICIDSGEVLKILKEI